MSSVSIAPGRDRAADPADWFGADGKPKNFHIDFEYGVAHVPDAVGRYMVANNLGRNSSIILPAGFKLKG
jgi:hypothetical protein